MLDTEYSVTQLSNMIKKSIESNFPKICLRGEVSALKVHSSGHMYFTLKDENANIDCVCWKFVAMSQHVKLADGMDIRCMGKVTTYPDRSKYQFVASSFEAAGEGALLKLMEERKQRLLAEGWFDKARKKPMPVHPKLIGVITSPTGAVIKDILHRVRARFPTPVLLYPVLVQGAQAVQQIIHAIHSMNSLQGENRPDILIVARGGGSLEDLMPFNDEDLVRCVAQSDIPIVSAVGHETDVTLIDLAADLRAPTPTAAAELVVPDMSAIAEYTRGVFNRLDTLFKKDIMLFQETIKSFRIMSPDMLIENRMQKADAYYSRLEKAYVDKIHYMTICISRMMIKKPEITNTATDLLSTRLKHAVSDIYMGYVSILSSVANLLESCSLQKMLKRGFMYAELENGQQISSKNDITERTRLSIYTYDGLVQLTATDVNVK